MTEDEWTRTTDPAAMLQFLRGTSKISDRKLRLFGVACCLLIWHLLPDERSRHAVEVAEAFADGLVSEDEAVAAGDAAAAVDDYPGVPAELAWRAARAADQLYWQVGIVWGPVATALEGLELIKEGATLETLDAWSDQIVESGRTMGCTKANPDGLIADLLREVIGPLPFRSIKIPASVLEWSGGVVAGLAAEIYSERRFEDLPNLADLLEQAGLEDSEAVAHFRHGCPHCRGCWALDLVLGKE